ncbi:hypothetical protein [Kribbella deserti]|uniref:Uncharacterized protein n=1 Tax=Kribbella deserti TaxID=1926257 RepID=A0ABV6QN08_9ACTN
MAPDFMRVRSTGRRGRAEIWYTTITDPITGAGVWLHHELIAPLDGAAPFTQGHVAVFLPGEDVVFERFGPEPWTGAPAFASGPVSFDRERAAGSAGGIKWDLTCATAGPPLFTFPVWAWRTPVLPAAHMVPVPAGSYTGVVQVGTYQLTLRDAPGATGRIYGHGMAQRWAWLHADLGGGDVLEVVAAIARRPPLNKLPALAFVRMRLDGTEWPKGDQLLATRLFRTELSLPVWRVVGGTSQRRLDVQVTLPPERVVAAPFTDPDGSQGTCHNSERADAEVRLERRLNRCWSVERQWALQGTAHAEVGVR